jgi:hypothetical protein
MPPETPGARSRRIDKKVSTFAQGTRASVGAAEIAS